MHVLVIGNSRQNNGPAKAKKWVPPQKKRKNKLNHFQVELIPQNQSVYWCNHGERKRLGWQTIILLQ